MSKIKFYKCTKCEFKYNTRILWGLCPSCFVHKGYENNLFQVWDKDKQKIYYAEVARAKEINPMNYMMPGGMKLDFKL